LSTWATGGFLRMAQLHLVGYSQCFDKVVAPTYVSTKSVAAEAATRYLQDSQSDEQLLAVKSGRSVLHITTSYKIAESTFRFRKHRKRLWPSSLDKICTRSIRISNRANFEADRYFLFVEFLGVALYFMGTETIENNSNLAAKFYRQDWWILFLKRRPTVSH
jgi:hypothetical protein